MLNSFKLMPLPILHRMGLSAGTVIRKETKEPNNRALPGALLLDCIASFVLHNLCLATYRRNPQNVPQSIVMKI